MRLSVLVRLVGAVALSLAVQPAVAQSPPSGFALVIGNTNYANAAALPSAAIDAGLVAATLQARGFDVLGGADVSQQSMGLLLNAFDERVRKAGASAAPLVVYLSGYAVSRNGESMFLSADTPLDVPADVGGMRIGDLMTRLSGLPVAARIVVVDGSRDGRFTSIGTALRTGPAAVTAPSGLLFASAAAPGASVASPANGNSVFARTLAENIADASLDAEAVFQRVRSTVSLATSGEQLPWYASGLVTPVSLGGPLASPANAAAGPAAIAQPATIATSPQAAPRQATPVGRALPFGGPVAEPMPGDLPPPVAAYDPGPPPDPMIDETAAALEAVQDATNQAIALLEAAQDAAALEPPPVGVVVVPGGRLPGGFPGAGGPRTGGRAPLSEGNSGLAGKGTAPIKPLPHPPCAGASCPGRNGPPKIAGIGPGGAPASPLPFGGQTPSAPVSSPAQIPGLVPRLPQVAPAQALGGTGPRAGTEALPTAITRLPAVQPAMTGGRALMTTPPGRAGGPTMVPHQALMPRQMPGVASRGAMQPRGAVRSAMPMRSVPNSVVRSSVRSAPVRIPARVVQQVRVAPQMRIAPQVRVAPVRVFTPAPVRVAPPVVHYSAPAPARMPTFRR